MRSLEGISDELKAPLVSDYRKADLRDIDRAILKYVEVLTLRPEEVTIETVVPLREHGLNDRALHDIVQVTAYFNYVNRIADGLGVELES